MSDLLLNEGPIKSSKRGVIPLSIVATMAEELASKLQDESLKIRKELFFDPELGFSHNLGGVRTLASRKDATEKINAITNGIIEFHFVSHRRLWFQTNGVDKRYILHASNEYKYGIEESTKMNPYRKIANELKKAAKEWKEMDEMYKLLKAA